MAFGSDGAAMIPIDGEIYGECVFVRIAECRKCLKYSAQGWIRTSDPEFRKRREFAHGMCFALGILGICAK